MNSITGPYGFSYYAATSTDHDEDELVDLYMSFDAVNHLTGYVVQETLFFVIDYKNDLFPLFTVRAPEFSFDLTIDDFRSFLKNHAVFPFEADQFVKDLQPYLTTKELNGQKYESISLEDMLANKDNILLATYRLIHTIYYHD